MNIGEIRKMIHQEVKQTKNTNVKKEEVKKQEKVKANDRVMVLKPEKY